MTEQTWAGIVNAPGGNFVQGSQIAEQGDVILVLNSFLSTAAQLSTLEQLSDETFKQINQILGQLSASYQHFSNLAQNEGLTGDEQSELLEQIRQSCAIFDEIQDARNQFEQIREDTASAVKGQLLQSRLSYLERRIWDRVSKLDLFKVGVAIRTAQEQSRRRTQEEQIRAIIESALPSRDAHSVLSINTFYTARSQLEEESETLRLAEEKLRVALPPGSVEHRSRALEILGDYFHPETLSTSRLGHSSDESETSPGTSTDNLSIAVLTLDDGGVRSLTSLLVLRELLCLVALELRGNREPMRPNEIFDIVVGSGTGGLAAILINDLAMPIDDGILHFNQLISLLFAEPRVGSALWRTKYSIEPVVVYLRILTQQYRSRSYSPIRGSDGELYPQSSSPDLPYYSSLIVCRELIGNKRMAEPVVLGGGHDFSKQDTLSFAEATMSIPGYFSPIKIMDRVLISGSVGETANPSQAAFDHLRKTDERFHQRKVQWVNIGASSQITGPPAYKAPWRGSSLIPSSLRDVLNIMDNTQGAQNTEPERVAAIMKMSVRYRGSKGTSFARFSVNVGDSVIEWDDHTAISSGLLQRRTESYLAQQHVMERLHHTAKMLAQRYKQRNIEAA